MPKPNSGVKWKEQNRSSVWLFLRDDPGDTQACRSSHEQGNGQEAQGFPVLNLGANLHLEHSSYPWDRFNAF